MNILKHIGAQVRSLRGERSQEEFAKKVGLPKSRISPIEQGKANITLNTLSQIATRAGGKLRIEIEKPSR